MAFELSERASGVLLHPTSLPGAHGSGDAGPQAHAFARWLHDAGQRWWQMLPLGHVGYGNSPYSALSAFAGDPDNLPARRDGQQAARRRRPVKTMEPYVQRLLNLPPSAPAGRTGNQSTGPASR